MRPVGRKRLGVTFALAMAAWFTVAQMGMSSVEHPAKERMRRAEDLARAAFRTVDAQKRSEGLPFPSDSRVVWKTVLGEDFTPMTTTLGSRLAKEVASNPSWAALLARWLFDAGVEEGDRVGITASASFPGLVLSTLAAVHSLDAEPVLAVSLGSSSFGANGRETTWLDMAAWVRDAGVLDTEAVLVTPGGESDRGEGMLAAGMLWIREAAERNEQPLRIPADLARAIALRMEVLEDRSVTALVNLGGGQAALGRCVHGGTLPVGPWKRLEPCRCADRGVLSRSWETGVPVIHLLRVRELAARHGLDPEPGRHYDNLTAMAEVIRVRWWVVGLALAMVALPLFLGRVRFGHSGLSGSDTQRGVPRL